MPITTTAAAVTALFVPGDRPEHFRKAIGSAADVVIIDLEDAVAPEAKEDALAAVLDYARSAIVIALRAADLDAPLDSPSVQISDAGVVADSAALARQFGFGGKLCVHPAQLEPVATAFRPSRAEVDWVRSVVGAAGGATQVNGQMIDRPATVRAERIPAATEPSTRGCERGSGARRVSRWWSRTGRRALGGLERMPAGISTVLLMLPNSPVANPSWRGCSRSSNPAHS